MSTAFWICYFALCTYALKKLNDHDGKIMKQNAWEGWGSMAWWKQFGLFFIAPFALPLIFFEKD